jgi:hypothetical protein
VVPFGVSLPHGGYHDRTVVENDVGNRGQRPVAKASTDYRQQAGDENDDRIGPLVRCGDVAPAKLDILEATGSAVDRLATVFSVGLKYLALFVIHRVMYREPWACRMPVAG